MLRDLAKNVVGLQTAEEMCEAEGAGKMEVVKTFVKSGGDPSLLDPASRTALHLAGVAWQAGGLLYHQGGDAVAVADCVLEGGASPLGHVTHGRSASASSKLSTSTRPLAPATGAARGGGGGAGGAAEGGAAAARGQHRGAEPRDT